LYTCPARGAANFADVITFCTFCTRVLLVMLQTSQMSKQLPTPVQLCVPRRGPWTSRARMPVFVPIAVAMARLAPAGARSTAPIRARAFRSRWAPFAPHLLLSTLLLFAAVQLVSCGEDLKISDTQEPKAYKTLNPKP